MWYCLGSKPPLTVSTALLVIVRNMGQSLMIRIMLIETI